MKNNNKITRIILYVIGTFWVIFGSIILGCLREIPGFKESIMKDFFLGFGKGMGHNIVFFYTLLSSIIIAAAFYFIPVLLRYSSRINRECAHEKDTVKNTHIELQKTGTDSRTVTIILGRKPDNAILDLGKHHDTLIAGVPGSGKTTCIHNILLRIMRRASCKSVRFILIDTQNNGLKKYEGIPHLLFPVIEEPKKGVEILDWCVEEMERRYSRLADMAERNIESYNSKFTGLSTEDLKSAVYQCEHSYMYRIVIVIDGLKELMKENNLSVESSLCKMAQLSKPCGISFIVTTDDVSKEVFTDQLKANISNRIAFKTANKEETKSVLNSYEFEAHNLNGDGDMFYYPVGRDFPEEIQGTFIPEDEVSERIEEILQG